MARSITGAFPESVKVGLRKVHFSSIKKTPKEYAAWANVMRGEDPGGEAGKHFLEDLRVASFGSYAPKPEGDPTQYDTPIEGELVRATPYSFSLGTRCTKEMKADGRYGIFDKQAAELGFAANHAMEVNTFKLLNGGFSTTGGLGHTAAGFDSLSLFDTAHTLLRGGTYGNRLATDVDLSVTGLELAQDTLHGTVNESNNPTPMSPAILIYNYQQDWIAKELLDSEQKPYTAGNEINPIAGTLRRMPVHYLTDVDSWFVLAEKDMHDLNMWLREDNNLEFGEDFDTGDTKIKGTFRMATWHGTWRGAFGSLGA